MKKLTVKQERFADHYIEFGNATEAAISAGYSKKTSRVIGQENLTKPAISSYIEKRMEELKSERVADQQEVLEYLTATMRGEVDDEVVMVVGDGDFGGSIEKENKRSDTSARTKAAELLGKRYRMWTDKVEHEGNVELVFEDDYGEEEN